MEYDELIEFQKIFASIDISDPLELRPWFEDYPELSISERSKIAGRSKATIKKWERKARVNLIMVVELDNQVVASTKRPPLYTPPSKPLPNINIPKDWDKNPKWVLNQHRDGISKRQLGFLLNCSRHKIRRLIIEAERPPIPQSILNSIA